MKKLGTLLSLCALGAVLAACGSSSITAPESARRNGSILGSGNFAGEPGAMVVTTTSDTTATAIARNGGILGSGN